MATPRALTWTRLVHPSWLAATALALSTFVILGVALVVWAGQRFEPPPVSFIQGQGVYAAEMLLAVAYAAMGWLLASRLPRNALGWVFLSIGLFMVVQLVVTFIIQQGHQAFRPLDPQVLLAAWLGSTFHLPSLVVSFVFIFLLFPEGRALSPRWAAFGWAALIGALLVCVGIGLSPAGLIWFPSLGNPFAAPQSWEPVLLSMALTGLLFMVLGVVVSAFSMFVRYGRAGDVQRAQLRCGGGGDAAGGLRPALRRRPLRDADALRRGRAADDAGPWRGRLPARRGGDRGAPPAALRHRPDPQPGARLHPADGHLGRPLRRRCGALPAHLPGTDRR
jgi:hypothetical protein